MKCSFTMLHCQKIHSITENISPFQSDDYTLYVWWNSTKNNLGKITLTNHFNNPHVWWVSIKNSGQHSWFKKQNKKNQAKFWVKKNIALSPKSKTNYKCNCCISFSKCPWQLFNFKSLGYSSYWRAELWRQRCLFKRKRNHSMKFQNFVFSIFR